MDIINDGWDMMIAHPPCTYISYVGNRTWNIPGKVFKRIDALLFFAKLWEAQIDRICIENPKGCASPTISKYTQEIQPYYFGDCEMKTTWLWLKNLPLLKYVMHDNLFEKRTVEEKPEPKYICNGDKSKGKKIYFCEGMKGTNRAHERSRFWPGIAEAMATQWGSLQKT